MICMNGRVVSWLIVYKTIIFHPKYTSYVYLCEYTHQIFVDQPPQVISNFTLTPKKKY